jgi:molecular chaperone DnaJ
MKGCNYYIILNVPQDASLQQIKAAYRRQAKRFHPDHYGPDSQPFREIQQAYAVLSDPQKRRRHDHELSGTKIPVSRQRSTAHRPPIEPIEAVPSRSPIIDLNDFKRYAPSYDEIFGRLQRNFFHSAQPKSEHPKALNVEVKISPDQARRGGTIELDIPVESVCPLCEGHGSVAFFECLRCSGSGRIAYNYPLIVSFPAGINHTCRVQTALDRLGIGNFYLTVQFVVSDE